MAGWRTDRDQFGDYRRSLASSINGFHISARNALVAARAAQAREDMDQTAQLRSLAEEMRQMADNLAGNADLNEWIAALNLAAEFDLLADQVAGHE
jgi:hypothetical protein